MCPEELRDAALLVVFDNLPRSRGNERNLLAECSRLVAWRRRFLRAKYPKSWKLQAHPKAKDWDKYGSSVCRVAHAAAMNYMFLFQQRNDFKFDHRVLDHAFANKNMELAKWLMDKKDLFPSYRVYYMLAEKNDLDGIKTMYKLFPDLLPPEFLKRTVGKKGDMFSWCIQEARDKVSVSLARSECLTSNDEEEAQERVKTLYQEDSDHEENSQEQFRRCLQRSNNNNKRKATEDFLDEMQTKRRKDINYEDDVGTTQSLSCHSVPYLDRWEEQGGLPRAIWEAIKDNDTLAVRHLVRIYAYMDGWGHTRQSKDRTDRMEWFKEAVRRNNVPVIILLESILPCCDYPLRTLVYAAKNGKYALFKTLVASESHVFARVSLMATVDADSPYLMNWCMNNKFSRNGGLWLENLAEKAYLENKLEIFKILLEYPSVEAVKVIERCLSYLKESE